MESVNVAVVGGGISGVYAAWRLQTDATYGEKGVALFEGSNRIGGRLESLTPPGAPQLRAEYGGMGFTSNHIHVWGLVNNVFQLEMTPFPDQTPDLLYLRGKHLTIANVNNGTTPYVLSTSEQGQQAADLVTSTVTKLIGQDPTTLTHQQWLALFAARTFDGLPAQQLGFWNFLTQSGGMSPEAYAFVRDSLGHDLQISNWNAADALEWFFADFAPDTKVMHLPGGYETLPQTLADAFEEAGGTLAMQTSVTRVADDGSGGFILSLGDGGQVAANVVILAIPQRALEIITPGSVILPDSDVQDLLASVTPLPVLKLFLTYDTPWWTANSVAPAYGRSVTDIPVRTVYYWGVEGDPVDPGNTNSLLMASYTDALELDFWEGLRNGALYPDQDNPWTSKYPGSPNWGAQQATTAMVNEATRQLAAVHPMLTVPQPYSTSFKDWRDDPYGGAMHAWNVGVMSDDIIAAVQQPRASANLFICGESYARKQGWAEGAITTAESVVELLGLAPPTWLPTSPPAVPTPA